ncbi:HD family hydrolase [archaeon]|jgi:putative hydrolases of HD superfamily|nr:HD family hydrolase [archaeon]MBT4023101.1 HD family hydrolase [archaeon]MBT4272499.1 HD family hydrolase [archaeon]MBT4460597.1 HD family hydrolase [archaeon]MBT4857813.1 HD family hydrolase [archaeon]
MDEKKLSNLLEIFLTVQVSKELPRQGFLYSGFKRAEADSVAAHSFSVCVLTYLLARELKEEGWKVNPDEALKIALMHDLGESITGDIGTYAKELARGIFDKVEVEAFRLLMRNTSNKKELTKYFNAYMDPKSLEAQIVKFADSLDAFAQAFTTSNAVIEDLEENMKIISKKKIKDPKLRALFNTSIRLISNKKVTLYKGHMGKNDETQETL